MGSLDTTNYHQNYTSYWNTSPGGRNLNPTDNQDGASGKTSNELKDRDTYGSDWNFNTIWGIKPGEYPRLVINDTDEDIPSPIQLTLVGVTTDRIKIRWEAPNPKGNINGYRVAWNQSATAPSNCAGETNVSSDLSESTFEYEISSLSAATQYSISVCAKTSRNYESAPISITTTTLSTITLADACLGKEATTQCEDTGSGTLADPYIICNRAMFNDIAVDTTNCGPTRHYKLDADIDFYGQTLNQINNLTGSFDGNNKTIYNYHKNSAGTNFIGLFNYIGSGGIVKNLNLKHFNLIGNHYIGALAGYLRTGLVQNVDVSESFVEAEAYGGLLIGMADDNSIIRSSSSAGYIRGENPDNATNGESGNSHDDIGGLVGLLQNRSVIEDSHSSANVSILNNINNDWVTNTGGLVGMVEGPSSRISNSYATGNVSGIVRSGGLVGFADYDGVIIENSYATGNVEGDNETGGFIGRTYRDVIIRNSYSTGKVSRKKDSFSAPMDSYFLGGFIGLADTGGTASDENIIEYSYAEGNVEGKYEAGGFVGRADQWSKIKSSYAKGEVKGINYIGGFVGNQTDDSIIEDSYAEGNVIATNDYVGGFAGRNYLRSTINRSFAKGSVQATGSDSDWVGGFIGMQDNDSSISQSYALGNVEALGQTASYVGGFAGQSKVGDSTIIDSYSRGNVIGGNNEVGGFIGQQNSDAHIERIYATGTVTATNDVSPGGLSGAPTADTNYITNSYYNKTPGNYNIGNTSGEDRTETELKLQSTYVNWDFDKTWEIIGGDGSNYPTLKVFNPTVANVTNLALHEANVNSIILKWDHPRGNVSGFKVAYVNNTSAPADCSTSIDVGNNVFATIKNLSPSTAYSFRVCSYNIAGDFSSGAILENISTVTMMVGTSCSGHTDATNCNDNTIASGDGSQANPWIICTAEQLIDIEVNPSCSMGHYYKQDADIDMSDYIKNQWQRIGFTSNFTGEYDGGNYKIYNLEFTDQYASDYVGMFAKAQGATLKNIHLRNVSMTGRTYVGGLIGYAHTSTQINNVSVEGSALGEGSYLGGIVGRLHASSKLDNSKAFIEVKANSVPYTGGLVGWLTTSSEILNSEVKGIVFNNSSDYTGGAVGVVESSSKVSNTHSFVTVNSNANYVGGCLWKYFCRWTCRTLLQWPNNRTQLF